MAVLEKIRTRFSILITVLIGFALLSFIVDADTLKTAMSMFSSKYDVGRISGKAITYQDFQKRMDYFNSINQLLVGNNVLSEPMQERIREQAWQEFIQEFVLEPQYNKIGLGVSNDEMESLIRGQFVSPILYNDPMFFDETGEFSRSNVLGFIQSINADRSGQRRAYWQYLERRIRDAQMIEKYISLIGQSRFLNELQLTSAVDGRNTLSDISYVVKQLDHMSGADINVTEAELRAYHKKHAKSFEQESSRDIEYVSFPILPSEEDIRATEEAFNKAFQEFKTTDDLRQFIVFNSDRPFDDFFYKKGELPYVLDNFAFSATMKDIMPVDREDFTYTTARIAAIRNLPDSVKVRHILIPFQTHTREEANRIADSLITALQRGANFGYLAQQYSIDQAANREDGDLGWIRQGDLRGVRAFEDTSFVVPKNKFFKVESGFGVHVAQVTDRSPEVKKVRLAVLTKTAEAGRATVQELFMRANELSSVGMVSYDNFVQLARERGYIRVPVYNISEGDRTVSIFENARDVVRWVFESNVHDVSNTFNMNNNRFFLVAAVTEVRREGIAPFAQVRDEIEQIVRREKQAAIYAQSMREAMSAGNIEAVANKLDLNILRASGVSFGSVVVQGVGIEPRLVGAVAGTPEHTLGGPVQGTMGVYVFNVDNREVGAAYTREDEILRSRMIFMQGRMFEFLPVLEKAAKVRDWRFRYF